MSGLVGVIGAVGDGVKLGIDITNMIEGITAFLNGGSKSLYLLDPIRQKLALRLDPGKIATLGAVLRMSTVCLESGLVRYIDQSGQFIDDGTLVPLIEQPSRRRPYQRFSHRKSSARRTSLMVVCATYCRSEPHLTPVRTRSTR